MKGNHVFAHFNQSLCHWCVTSRSKYRKSCIKHPDWTERLIYVQAYKREGYHLMQTLVLYCFITWFSFYLLISPDFHKSAKSNMYNGIGIKTWVRQCPFPKLQFPLNKTIWNKLKQILVQIFCWPYISYPFILVLDLFSILILTF